MIYGTDGGHCYPATAVHMLANISWPWTGYLRHSQRHPVCSFSFHLRLWVRALQRRHGSTGRSRDANVKTVCDLLVANSVYNSIPRWLSSGEETTHANFFI
jgi:hypothetical protein